MHASDFMSSGAQLAIMDNTIFSYRLASYNYMHAKLIA